MKTSLGDLAEGTIVPMLERGSKVNYIVAKHNYQSDVNGGGHTMLIRAGVLGSYKWENSNSSSHELPEYAKYDTDSQIPDVLESYYQSAFDELTLAACKPVRIKYSPNGSTVTSTKSHRFFILSRGDLASWSYSDGDLLNATVVNALVSSVGNNVSLLLRSTTYDYDTKLDPDSNTYVQDGDKYGAVYIAAIRNNRLYDTSRKNHGHEAAYVLPCIVLYDTAGVGEDGILRGNHIPEISSYYFGTEQVHTKHNDFRVAYSVHDEDGDEMTVTELLDGKTVLRTYTPVDGETNNTVWVGSALLPLGEYGVDHKLTVRVTDGAATAEKHYLFRMTYKQGYAVYIGKIAGNADRTGYYWTERHALHDASDETLPIVLEPELTLEKNSFGSFVFTVPAINPYYDKLALKTTVISVEEDGVEIFMGYVTELNKNFDLDIEVTCEGELGYLQDRDCIIENRAYATEELVRLAVTPDGDYGTNFATEGKCYRYGSINMPINMWGPWHTATHKTEGGLADVKISMEDMITPEKVMDIFQFFTMFATDKKYRKYKIICRYQQFEGANMIVDRVVAGYPKKGLIWHFQGSGKSLLMVFAAQKLRMNPELKNPTVVIVDDRIDLETQITATFNASDIPNLTSASTKEELISFFRGDMRKILITTIFKFGEVSGELNARDNIIVMVDEAHRTQEGDLGEKMRMALPNAFFFGLTGTPINRVDKNHFCDIWCRRRPHRIYESLLFL